MDLLFEQITIEQWRRLWN